MIRRTMSYRAVLFDLDGTLLDTLDDLGDSMNTALASRGYPVHPISAYSVFVGDGVENLVRRALPEPRQGDQALVRAMVPLMRAEYARRWKSKTRPYEGIPELLDRLTARGVKMAVLSNKPHPATVEVVAHFFPRWRFDPVLGARPGVPIKPDAGAALEAARILSLPAAAFLYVGDTDTDMETARSAGMRAVGALWGFRGEEELRSSGAEVIIRHPRDLLELLEGTTSEG
jgi:phosphoglycolate phosphatase